MGHHADLYFRDMAVDVCLKNSPLPLQFASNKMRLLLPTCHVMFILSKTSVFKPLETRKKSTSLQDKLSFKYKT